MNSNELIKKLAEPMPYKWRIQSASKYKPEITCVAYIDSRDVMDRLDSVVGAGNWQRKHELIGKNLYCSIGVKIDGEWVWKSDCGTESQTEKEKGQSSDSFKRAAVNFGIGRFLYTLGLVKIEANETKNQTNKPYPIDAKGKRIWHLNDYIINTLGRKQVKEAVEPRDFQTVIGELGVIIKPAIIAKLTANVKAKVKGFEDSAKVVKMVKDKLGVDKVQFCHDMQKLLAFYEELGI
jgi:hypothetical protein